MQVVDKNDSNVTDLFKNLPASGKKLIIGGIILIIAAIIIITRCTVTVPAGYVKVATLFGKVQQTVYTEGLHLTNPMYSFTSYDVRNQSLMFEQVPVPTQDQLTSNMDVRIQYRVIGVDTPSILMNTGSQEQLIEVKLRAQVFSLIRDVAKTVLKAEDFFDSKTQSRLQSLMLSKLKGLLQPAGINVQDVLLSNTVLPSYIIEAIKGKKVREQEVQREKAELQRIAIQSRQRVVKATSNAEAATQEAISIKTLADAEAYRISEVSKSLHASKGYIQLQAIQALTKMAKDPATKMYFINSDSPQPFPLLNIGESKKH